MSKIYIVGIVASGKTTLAKQMESGNKMKNRKYFRTTKELVYGNLLIAVCILFCVAAGLEITILKKIAYGYSLWTAWFFLIISFLLAPFDLVFSILNYRFIIGSTRETSKKSKWMQLILTPILALILGILLGFLMIHVEGN